MPRVLAITRALSAAYRNASTTSSSVTFFTIDCIKIPLLCRVLLLYLKVPRIENRFRLSYRGLQTCEQ